MVNYKMYIMKHPIYNYLVLLFCMMTIVACTNDIPADENTLPDGTRVVSLGNILPDTAKPGYTDLGSRANAGTTASWTNNDELLLKVTISGNSKNYFACAKLVYNGSTWSIQSELNSATGNVKLLDPQTGIVLTGTSANLKVVKPDELGSNVAVSVEVVYAPDLKWSSLDTKTIESSPSTHAPEYWTLNGSTWQTDYACVKVEAPANEAVTLSGSNVKAYNSSATSFNATPINGFAYFYCKPVSAIKTGFTIKQGNNTLFDASTLNPVTLVAGNSYFVDVQ